MLDKIIEQIEYNGAEILPQTGKTRLTELYAFGVGFGAEHIDGRKPSWRMQITRYLDIFAEYGTKMLITVDEIDTSLSDMVELISDFQHFIREKREIALIMAGLPGKALRMFQEKDISFTRRAYQYRLKPVSISDVKTAIKKTVESSGRSIGDGALNMAAEYTKGFPFLIQLVGHHIWRQSPESKAISVRDVSQGIESADEQMERMILETTVNELSDNDLSFLYAMLPDKAESKIKDIIKRLNCTAGHASQYRLRLIRYGAIEEYGRGKVQFAMPLMKEYLAKIKT
jgi:hypothetical protein